MDDVGDFCFVNVGSTAVLMHKMAAVAFTAVD